MSTVARGGHVQQSQDVELQGRQFRLEDLEGFAVGVEGMALGEAEEAQDVLGGRSPAGAALGVSPTGT